MHSANSDPRTGAKGRRVSATPQIEFLLMVTVDNRSGIQI